MDAFDANALIYAAVPQHRLGRRVLALFQGSTARGGSVRCCCPRFSVSRSAMATRLKVRILAQLLARLDLRPVDRATADIATALASRYGLRTADATHLATAVALGADRFITDNQRDFPISITEVTVTYPSDLPDRAG
jgi:predicted nucleic acid-binding protein